MARSVIPQPGEGLQFIFVDDSSGGSLVHIKASVATYNDLPITGNTENDLRITQDTDRMYTWSIANPSGNLSDWTDIGQSISIDWSAITGKPTATPSEIDDAVADSHTQGTDQKLDDGGVNEVTAANAKDAVDKKHTQNTDTGTTSETFAIDSDASGFEPVKIKNESGVLSARNDSDDDYVIVRAKNPVNNNDVTTKGWVETNLPSISNIIKNSNNIMINAFRIAVNGALTVFNMIDGMVDEYVDESGIDAVSSMDELYDSDGDFYTPDTDADAFTKLLLHFDGLDGATTTIDSSASEHTVTLNGDAELDSAQKKFGTTSVVLDGAGDYVSVPQSSDFDFSSVDWTIDLQVRFNDLAQVNQCIVAGTVTYAFALVFNDGLADKKIALDLSSNGSSWDMTSTNKGTKADFTTGVWYHIELSWDGSDYRIFVDGVEDNKYTSSTGIYGTTGIQIGKLGAATLPFDGWFDELRVSKGIARHTSNFTPPTQPYSGIPADMTLISEAFSAESEPDNARIVILEEDIDVITINTDLKAYASKDGGSSWAQITLSDEGDYDTDKRIFVGSVDLTTSGIGSGTSMVYKINTLNDKNLNIHATALSWD